jgi:hypothetical protein
MADMKAWRREMKTDREATKAYPEKMEANPEEIMPVSEQQEEAAMETITELEN